MNISTNKKIRRTDLLTITIIIVIAIALFLHLFLKPAEKKDDIVVKSLEDVKTSEIAVLTGSNAENVARETFPDATLMTYNLNSDALYAVEIGNVKYGMALSFVIDDYNKKRGNVLEIVGEPVKESESGIFFARNEKNKTVLPQFNEFLNKIKENGELKKIDARWFDVDGEIINLDYDSLNGENGTLIFAVDAAYPPFTYVYNNEVVGYDAEVVYRFCQEYNYALDVRPVDFNGMLTGIKSGKFDIGGGGNAITEERKKSVDFSDPLKKNKMCVYTAAGKTEASLNFMEGLKDTFYKTFIQEDRYKLFLEGLKATIFMSCISIILGTILSFVICLLRLTNSVVLNKICDAYVSILEGIPVLVILLLLYYIVFKSSSIPGEYIAIIAFTLNFSAYVSEIMITSIRGVDKGQWEAAYALGFSYWVTFLKFIFKQSLVSIIPVYKGEIISLIKSTSIVGYIAVQDLTKMSDIVRSRTFEPFVPILTIALIYYIFSFLASNILNYILLKVKWEKK